MMVERALKLRDSLEDYNAKMQRSTDPADSEVCLDDITSDDWEMLVKIKVLFPLSEWRVMQQRVCTEHYGKLL